MISKRVLFKYVVLTFTLRLYIKHFHHRFDSVYLGNTMLRMTIIEKLFQIALRAEIN